MLQVIFAFVAVPLLVIGVGLILGCLNHCIFCQSIWHSSLRCRDVDWSGRP